MKTMLRIQVDDREARSAVPEQLRGMEDVAVEVCRLAKGDYNVADQAIVERKTLADFAASIVDGRLFKQLGWLAAGHLQPALILEGTAADLGGLGVSREALQGAMVSASVVFGVPVLRARGPEETARLIRYMAGQLARIALCGRPRSGWKPRSSVRRQLYVLQGFPGIGPERAKRLLTRFGRVRDVMNADAQSLAEVKGIGSVTAEKIVQVLGGTRDQG